MVAITRNLRAHLGQRSASTPYVRRSSTAHATRDDASCQRRPGTLPPAPRRAPRASSPCSTAPKRRRAAATTWKIYLVMGDAELEADFVVARTDLTARRAFLSVYGDGGANAELVAPIEKPSHWLKRAMWLGPWRGGAGR